MRLVWSVFLALTLPSLASAATIHGRVTDATGASLPGVTVEIAEGQKLIVATTDANGAYSAEVGNGNHQLTFKLLDFATVLKSRVTAPAEVDVKMALETSAEIVVTGKQTFHNLADLDAGENDLIGVADAASVGVVTAKQLDVRPMQRPGDVMESVPGVVTSQHSGEGKANQYYLRGFNLDHGTDFNVTVAGAPVNMPTHAHGQGYADANFVIPELISGVQYKKGPYSADQGDFASAGAVNINYVNVLDKPVVSLTGGAYGYERALAAGSRAFGGGELLAAFELSRNDGPWSRPDDFRKLNGLIRYTGGSGAQAYSVTLSGYDGRWNSTDQVPERAVESGLLPRFGAIDLSDGGKTHRWSAVADWQRSANNTLARANAYVIDYGLDLFSNFTYFLDDPENGDQFEQLDRRVVAGGRSTYQWIGSVFGRPAENLAGLDLRHDRIGTVALYHTRERERLETIREDRVRQTSTGLFAQTSVQWTEKLRTVTGLRADGYRFGVDGGSQTASIASPKLSVIAGPWHATELYLSAGGGFHSNDARGAIDPLVRTKGAEVGLRTIAVPRLHTTVALWALDVASELVFVGDAGTTEASRPSRRSGVEWTNYFRITQHLFADADFAWSRARFRDAGPAGNRIPGAVERVITAGLSLSDYGRWSGSIRYRSLGARPLIEDNSIRSRPSDVLTAEVGFAILPHVRLVAEGLNLTNARASDIDYFYASRLPNEPPGGVDDLHTHPLEPRSLRVRLETSW